MAGVLDRSLMRLSQSALGAQTLGRLRWFWLDSLFANISICFFSAYVPLLVQAYGASNAQVGQLAAFGSLMAVAALFPGARAIPLFGRRKLMVLMFSGGVGRLALLGLACVPVLAGDPQTAILAVIGCAGLNAFATSFSHPAWTSLTADIVPAEIRGRFFGYRGQATNLVTLSIVPLAGWLISRTNGALGLPFAGYQLVFGLAFVTGMIATACYARIDEPGGVERVARGQSLGATLGAMRGQPLFLAFVASALVWNLGFQISLPFFNVYLAGPLEASTSTIGLVNAVMPLTALLSQRWLGRLIDRRGNIWVQAVMGLPIPLMPLGWMLVTEPWHVIFINIPAGLFWAGYNLAAFNLLLELAPERARADAAALYQFTIAGATIVGPLLGGYVADLYGFKAMFAASAAMRMMGALTFIWWVARPAALTIRARSAR